MPYLPLLFTIFLDFFGFGLVFLILPALFLESHQLFAPSLSAETRGLLLGAFIASYFLTQFFTAPFIGALSDRFGRKPLLLWSLALAAAAYLFATWSIDAGAPIAFFLARILAGAAGGNITIAQSAVADLSSPTTKSKNFALIGMAMGLGYVFGPPIGIFFVKNEVGFNLAFQIPFAIAAFLNLLNFLFVILFFKETLKTPRKTELTLLKGVREIRTGLFSSPLRLLFLSYFLFSFGWGFFVEFLPVLILYGYQFEMSKLGWLYTSFGLFVALCQGWLIRPFLGRYKSALLLRSGYFFTALLLAACLLSKTLLLFMVLIPPIIFVQSFIVPSCATLVSDMSSKEQQGEVLGINQSMQAAALGLCPLFTGSFVAKDPFTTLWFSSFCILLAWGISLYWRPKCHIKHPIEKLS